MSPTWLDVVFVILMLALGIVGFKRGFILEVVETFGAIVATIIAFRFFPSIGNLLGIGESSAWGSKAALLVGIFLIVMVAISIAGHYVRKMLKAISLGTFDHLAGFLLGVLKACLITTVISVTALWVGQQGQSIVEQSTLARANLIIMNKLAPLLPDQVRKKYEDLTSIVKPAGGFSSIRGFRVEILDASGLEAQHLSGKVTEWSPSSRVASLTYTWEGVQYGIKAIRRYSNDLTMPDSAIQVGLLVEFKLGYKPETSEVFAYSLSLKN